MFQVEERKVQTKVKHEILDEYLIKWGSIIRNGLRSKLAQPQAQRAQFKARFVYVDYFACAGIYTEKGEPVYGSPVIGISRLDEIKQSFANAGLTFPVTTAAILFEKDAHTYNRLLVTLTDMGYGARIRETTDFMSLRDGHIAVVHDDSSKHVDAVLRFLDDKKPYSFHFIDPYGVDGVERRNVERIVSLKGADCIINMMLNPISRFIQGAIKPNPSATEEAYAKAFDSYFGCSDWRDIADRLNRNVIKRQQADMLLATLFHSMLQDSDSRLSVKQIPLQFEAKDQKLYHLFLTTHDPTGALTMNEIIDDARIREYDYRIEKRQTKVEAVQTALPFMTQIPDQNRPKEPVVEVGLLAEQIYKRCQKQVMKLRDVFFEMHKSPYYQRDIKEALGRLREEGRANFEGAPQSLPNKAEITFA